MIDAPQFREAILEQPRKITSSALFENAGLARALLDYLDREAVNGRGDQLKEYTIGSEGLGRGDSFDPRTDTIVVVLPTDHHKVMVASYAIKAGQFTVEQVRPWSDTHSSTPVCWQIMTWAAMAGLLRYYPRIIQKTVSRKIT
jgi:hypothetical protein